LRYKYTLFNIIELARVYRVSGKKVPLYIEFLVGITLKIELKGYFFSGDTVVFLS